MKPPVFSYHDPRSLAEAVSLLGRLENAKVLAGGQSLMPMLNMRYVLPDHVVDLGRVEGLAYIRDDGEAVVVGAMTRQRDIEFSPLVKEKLPLLAEAILSTGHRQTRNRGTIGGSLCHLDPSAEQVTVAAALDATLTIEGPRGRRTMPFAEFPVAFMTPNIEPDELLVEIRLPAWPKGHGYGFVEFARRHGDFAIASAAALLQVDGSGKIARASLTLGGVDTAPLRMTEAEELMVGQVPDEGLFRAAGEICGRIEAMDDALVPASYRRKLAAVMSRRALVLAQGRVERP